MFKKTYLLDETPGSISNIYEIKILICRILNELDEKITTKQLNTILQLTKTVNYFNFCQAIEELEINNQIAKNEKKQLYLTKLGKEIAASLEENISKNTIKKNVTNIKKMLREEHENKNKKIYVKRKNDGYIVGLVLEEVDSNLMELEIFCPTLEIAKNTKEQMKNKTIKIYKTILSIINE